jgi:purine-binding chemotaxis protein CheW
VSQSLEHYFDELLNDPEGHSSGHPDANKASALEKQDAIDDAVNPDKNIDSDANESSSQDTFSISASENTRASNVAEAKLSDDKGHTLKAKLDRLNSDDSMSLTGNAELPASQPKSERRLEPDKKQESALVLEKKAELQKLLSQQALFAKQEIEPQIEPKVDLKDPEPQVSAELPQVELETDSAIETYDSFHNNLEDLAQWAENGRPVWAQDKFEALLFEVSGLTLAVPLVSLGQIFPLTDELTTIFGQSDWMMGLLPSTLGRLRVVNTALFVMPEKYDDSFPENAKYVVSIDGVPWALAVDCVNQPVTLDPDEIRWRSERGKRAWLAGTVKSAMCALLDIPQMAQILAASDKNL